MTFLCSVLFKIQSFRCLIGLSSLVFSWKRATICKFPRLSSCCCCFSCLFFYFFCGLFICLFSFWKGDTAIWLFCHSLICSGDIFQIYANVFTLSALRSIKCVWTLVLAGDKEIYQTIMYETYQTIVCVWHKGCVLPMLNSIVLFWDYHSFYFDYVWDMHGQIYCVLLHCILSKTLRNSEMQAQGVE